jgi:hypothetical protein
LEINTITGFPHLNFGIVVLFEFPTSEVVFFGKGYEVVFGLCDDVTDASVKS